MSILAQSPKWQASQLGQPIPDSPHAISVCLPGWKDVHNYEQNDPATLQSMQCGYPRFFIHPLVKKLCNEAREELCDENSDCLLFSDLRAAHEAKYYVERHTSHTAEIQLFRGVRAVIVKKIHFARLQEIWRFAGEGISSRQAQDILEEQLKQAHDGLELRQILAGYCGGSADELYLYPSGMAAIFAAYRISANLGQRKKTLQLGFPYVDLLKIQQHYGTGVEFPHIQNGEQFAACLKRIAAGEFSCVFMECPTNPLLECYDVAAISAACKQGDTPLVLDDTLASCYNIDLAPYADLLVTSLSKWISGRGDVLAGQLRLLPHSRYYHQLKANISERDGHNRLYSGDYEVLANNAAHFEARMPLINANALRVAEMLAAHPKIARVYYPGLGPDANYMAIKREHGGFGGIISLDFHQQQHAIEFYDRLQVCKGPSLGTDFTLVCPFVLLAHYHELDWAESYLVKRDLVRLSIGAEDVEQLLGYMAQALA